MPTLAQKVFKLIVLHNKLVPQHRLEDALASHPDPVDALEDLVIQGDLSGKAGDKLVEIYRKQLPKAVRQKGDDGSVQPSLEKAMAWSDAGSSGVELIEEEPKKKSASSGGSSSATAAPPSTSSSSAAFDDDDDDVPPPKPEPEPEPEPAQDTEATSVSPDEAPELPESAASFTASEEGVATVHKVLKAARKFKASDVHIKAGQNPTLRVSGHLRPLDGEPIPPEKVQESLLSLLTEEQRQEFLDNWDLDFCYDGGELGRYRTNYMMQQHGMDAVFRCIDSEVKSFEELGLPPVVKKFTQYKTGIVLITGPKGCGKTTTLSALVDLINRTRPEHIITVEDPIEFVHLCKKGHVNQREVGPHTDTFSNALRAALREAPDVIVVGEMRDLETTELAITAAETGHLVFATLHTPDAVRTIGRILDVFPPKQQGQIRAMVSESLRGVVSQLLVPSIDGKSMELAVEVLVNTSAIGNLIRDSRTFQLPSMMQTGKKLGMQTMDDSLLKLAQAGKIKRDDAISLASNPGPMKAHLAEVVVE